MTSATQILSLTFNRRRDVNSQPQMGTHHANFVTTRKCNAIIHYITPTRVCQDGKRCLLFKNSLIFSRRSVVFSRIRARRHDVLFVTWYDTARSRLLITMNKVVKLFLIKNKKEEVERIRMVSTGFLKCQRKIS